MTSKAFELAQLGDAVTVDGSGNVDVTGSILSDQIFFGSRTGTDRAYVGYVGNDAFLWNVDNGVMRFGTNDSERMRLTADGTLLVGKTASDYDGGVFEAGSAGTYVSRSGMPFGVNRNDSDGSVTNFYKDGTEVGSIRSRSGVVSTIILDPRSGGMGIGAGGACIIPMDENGSIANDAKDVGTAGGAWDDIYATNGTIQTSDRNEKQDIAALTDAEITAAKAISKLFKTFKWKSKVSSKGDNARTHTGVIAQEVETAMSDAGLDAGNYAFFISNTWWETSTEVAAVEADEENFIKAQKAYTRIDTYNTSEEAPEGATERNRKGIRYPELLSFIGAATEQRLTNIETRLDALEAE